MNKLLTHFVPAIVVLALAVVSSSAVLPPRAETSAEAEPAEAGPLALAVELEAMIPQWCLPCFSCADDNGHPHGYEPSPLGGRVAFHPHGYVEGSNCGSHPSCGGEAMSAAADLIDSLMGSTPSQLALLAVRYPNMVRVNESRRALQLVGCNNRVIASYSSKTIPALKALLQTAI